MSVCLFVCVPCVCVRERQRQISRATVVMICLVQFVTPVQVLTRARNKILSCCFTLALYSLTHSIRLLLLSLFLFLQKWSDVVGHHQSQHNNNNNNNNTDTLCAVCLEVFQPDSLVCSCHACHRTLHVSCACQWLVRSDDCPYCRQDFTEQQQQQQQWWSSWLRISQAVEDDFRSMMLWFL